MINRNSSKTAILKEKVREFFRFAEKLGVECLKDQKDYHRQFKKCWAEIEKQLDKSQVVLTDIKYGLIKRWLNDYVLKKIYERKEERH